MDAGLPEPGGDEARDARLAPGAGDGDPDGDASPGPDEPDALKGEMDEKGQEAGREDDQLGRGKIRYFFLFLRAAIRSLYCSGSRTP